MLTTLIEGEEVRQNAKSTWSIKIKELRKIPEPTKRDLLVLWRKRHFRFKCTKPKKKQNQKFGDDNDFVNSVEDIGDALILSVKSPVESWILDSGTSFHSSPSKELFKNFKSGNFGKMYLTDNKALEIEGKGNVCINTTSGN